MQFHVSSPLSFLLPTFLNCPKDFFGGNNKRLPFFSPLRGSINRVDLEKMLEIAYWDAKIAVDAAENDRSEKCVFGNRYMYRK